jgi:hypothetical protein
MTEAPSVTGWLKAQTAEHHDRVERHPFVECARRGELRLGACRGYLRALASLHGQTRYRMASAAPATRIFVGP